MRDRDKASGLSPEAHMGPLRPLLVFRGLPGQEGRDADAAVHMVQVAHEVVALLGQLVVQCLVRRIVQQLLDAGQCVGARSFRL